MTKENILEPEIELIKSNEFYLFYEMMIQSLKTDNVKKGIDKSLSMLRTYLNSDNIIILKKNKEGIYTYNYSDKKLNELNKLIEYIINYDKKEVIENHVSYLYDLNLSENMHNIMFTHATINEENKNDDYIVAILNIDKNIELEEQFWKRLWETIQIILKRATSYEKNIRAISTDLLTGLDNRNAYEMRLQNLNENDENIVLGIFDMFRLKYINDNYTHDVGDKYIIEVANILNKYWPKKKVCTDENGNESIKETGNCIYRIGGDEFVLIANEENIQLTKLKAELAREEANLIDLGIEDDIPLGFNFGIVQHKPTDYIKHTFMEADEQMQKDKYQMYQKYKVERRR